MPPIASIVYEIPICAGFTLLIFRIVGKLTKFMPTAVANKKKLMYNNLISFWKFNSFKIENIEVV